MPIRPRPTTCSRRRCCTSAARRHQSSTTSMSHMLREYVNRGGFIFADAVCKGVEFDRGFRVLIDRIFPEPDYRLRLLPPEHPVWSLGRAGRCALPPALWGVDSAAAPAWCTAPITCRATGNWPGRDDARKEICRPRSKADRCGQENRRQRAVLCHEPRPEIQARPAAIGRRRAEDSFGRAKLYVATVKHSGGGNVAPMALPNLLRYVSGELGLRLVPTPAN